VTDAAAPIVLVHGAWHGGWCWRRVVERLGGTPHAVFAPTLTGLGERSHLAGPHVDLETHIADVVGLIEAEELERVVLCGHSYGGLVITGVADRLPSRIAALFYLDAFVPEAGQSMLAIQGPERAARLRAAARDGWRVGPLPASYFAVASAADAAWVDRRSVDQPIGTFEQALALTGAWQEVPSLTYVRALGHVNGPFARYSDKFATDPRWHYREVPCGHDVMIDMPDALAELLLEAASHPHRPSPP
jgi:pimeloyl-ACP methyl ester carboxylesterase